MQNHTMNEPVEAASALVRERFPEAVAAFLGGSTARGQGTATSDLDVVVILPEPAEVYRETVAWADRPAELFVHTAASVRTMFAWDRANGAPIMSFMCAHGAVLLDLDGRAGPADPPDRTPAAARGTARPTTPAAP
ncbi:nucleotidyltransferase domain-containing protein [Saccharothrix sp. ST-888]|uniref:nucleotidyltransferase domain-containing protein n=1 Tax=Saccharothrix sp. ST-888 TaxID=1427391 RepID=UPI000697BB44|nr:nucleotidyltransferase domain-containing protein [Saccharothrix sp. ST-888]